MTQKRRTTADWEKIEAEYCAGVLSLREIARQHEITDTAIRKRAKKYGWERDLSEKVSSKVRSELVRSEVRTRDPLKEKEIVEAAAAQSVEVVRSHRKRLKRLHETADTLSAKLRQQIEDGDDDVRGMSQAMSHVANTVKTLTLLERQAFNIDDDPNRDRPQHQQCSDDELNRRLAKLLSDGTQ
jgi:glutamate-1-semialdehyde aminotransferase